MTQRDVVGREVGGGFMFGNACKKKKNKHKINVINKLKKKKNETTKKLSQN